MATNGVNLLDSCLHNLSKDSKHFYDCITQLKASEVKESLINKSEQYIKKEKERTEKVQAMYKEFSDQLEGLLEKYMNDMNMVRESETKDFESFSKDVDEAKEELSSTKEMLDQDIISSEREPSFVYKDSRKSNKLSVDLIKRYSGSRLYQEYISNRRTEGGDIYIDHEGKNEDLVLKYMNDDKTLIDDIEKLSEEEKKAFLSDLEWHQLPVKSLFMNDICATEDNTMMDAWKNHRVIMVNSKNAKSFNSLLKKNDLFNSLFNSQPIRKIQYNKDRNIFYVTIKLKYLDLIENYMKNGKKITNRELLRQLGGEGKIDEFVKELRSIGYEVTDSDIESIRATVYRPIFMQNSIIIDNKDYDKCLQGWLENKYDWKCVYRASRDGFTAQSFHNICDNVDSPTLVIIKSSKGWIFGGYTTQSWKSANSGNEMKEDNDAFIFSLKNPHGTSPMRFRSMKQIAIISSSTSGPIFGVDDINIGDNCNKSNSCSINNDGTHGFSCDPSYKCSLFVNTSKPDRKNTFSITDYEVFAIDYTSRYTIDGLCKYPDIVSTYVQTNEILFDSLTNVDHKALIEDVKKLRYDTTELELQLRFHIEHPSAILPGTKIVDAKYDRYLRDWLGSTNEWKLAFRASEHKFDAAAFHSCCDDRGATFIVIQSSTGWVFGGYASQSWSGNNEWKDDNDAFIFTLSNPHDVVPTRFMKRATSRDALFCNPSYGPSFSGDICINNKCNNYNSCVIHNDGTRGYECNPLYRMSLFVNTNKADEDNFFAVRDYEVYSINFASRSTVYSICKNPDIIWNLIENDTVSEESVSPFTDDLELLNDLDLVKCEDSNWRLRISQKCLKDPSLLLPNSTIMEAQYDEIMKQWLGGESKWKLIFRSSEHDYSGPAFHEYCDDKGPTLVVIKSSSGWIFGGYTTQSWKGNFEDRNDDNAFIFTLKNPHQVPPTRYMKRSESPNAIYCNPQTGPIFGDWLVCITDKCNTKNSCWINTNGEGGYDCHQEYRKSLFVNTDKPDSRNCFSVLDYEVYCQE